MNENFTKNRYLNLATDTPMKSSRHKQSTAYCVFTRLTAILFLVLLGSLHNTVRADNSLQSDNKPLIMGVLPYLSGMQLFKRYAPLKDHLAEKLGREITLVTAKDFSVFAKRTREREYDIVITAPHLAVVANDSSKYRIITRVKKDLITNIVVLEDSGIDDLSQLSGAVIATPPELAIVTKYGKDKLQHYGLDSNAGTVYRAYKSHNAAYSAVLAQHATAAIVGANAIDQTINAKTLRIVSTFPPLPTIATLVATDLTEPTIEAITKIMVTLEDDNLGLAVLEKLNLPGYQISDIDDYEQVRRYVGSNKINDKSSRAH